jgi:hypothetical protein
MIEAESIITLFISAVGLLLNTIMLAALLKGMNESLSFNFNMAFADGLTSFVIILLQILGLAGVITVQSACSFYGFSLSYSNALSVFSLLAMAFVHFQMFVHHTILSSRHWISLLVMVHLGSVFFSIFPSLFDNFTMQPSGLYCMPNYHSSNPFYVTFNIGTILTLAFTPIVIAVVYFRILRKISKIDTPLYVVKTRATPGQMDSKSVSVNALIMKRAVLLTASFALVWYFPVSLFAYQTFTHETITPEMDKVVLCLLLLKNCINPVLSFILDTRCRSAVFKLFRIHCEEVKLLSLIHI